MNSGFDAAGDEYDQGGGGRFRGRGRGFRGGFRTKNGFFKKYRPHTGRMSESIKSFYDELYPSDIRIENLDQQLRVWVGQLLENSLESKAKQIEVRFFNSGAEGFDVIDDGEGIPEDEFESLPECLDERATNEMYKTRSIGFKGEALYCLIKSSDVTIMSRHKDASQAFLVRFDRDGQILRKQDIQMEICGTIIEVRNIFEIDAGVSAKYKQQATAQFDYTMTLLNQFSMILYNTTLVITAGKLVRKSPSEPITAMQTMEEKVKCKWQTHGCGNFLQNVRYILQNQFGQKLPELPQDLIKIDFKWEAFDIEVIMARPVLNGKKTFLTKRTCHAYLNMRPIELQQRVKSVFFEIYNEFKVGTRSMPFTVVHFKTENHSGYDLKLSLDIRNINFNPRQQSELWGVLREKIKAAFIKCVQETPEGEGLSRGEIERKMREASISLRPEDNKRMGIYTLKQDSVKHDDPIKPEPLKREGVESKFRVMKDEKAAGRPKGSMTLDFDSPTQVKSKEEAKETIKVDNSGGSGSTGSFPPAPVQGQTATPGHPVPPGPEFQQQLGSQAYPYPVGWQPGMPYPYPLPYPPPPPGSYGHPVPYLPPGEYPPGAYPPGWYPPPLPGQYPYFPMPNPQMAPTEVKPELKQESAQNPAAAPKQRIQLVEQSSDSGSEEGEDEQEELAEKEPQPQLSREEQDALLKEYQAFLSMGYYEFVNRTYMEPFEEAKKLMKGRHEQTQMVISSIVKSRPPEARGEPHEESTAESSGKVSGSKEVDFPKFDYDYFIDLTVFMDKVQALKGKSEVNVLGTIQVSSNEEEEPKVLCIVALSDMKTFYATTLKELESEQDAFRALPLIDINQEKARRLGYRRLKKVQLKYNKGYKASRKAKKSKPNASEKEQAMHSSYFPQVNPGIPGPQYVQQKLGSIAPTECQKNLSQDPIEEAPDEQEAELDSRVTRGSFFSKCPSSGALGESAASSAKENEALTKQSTGKSEVQAEELSRVERGTGEVLTQNQAPIAPLAQKNYSSADQDAPQQLPHPAGGIAEGTQDHDLCPSSVSNLPNPTSKTAKAAKSSNVIAPSRAQPKRKPKKKPADQQQPSVKIKIVNKPLGLDSQSGSKQSQLSLISNTSGHNLMEPSAK